MSLHAPPARRLRQQGLALAEILVTAAILSIGLLGHAASILSSHQMSVRHSERGRAVQFAGRVIERLRADPDWKGLYGRLKSRSAESSVDAARAHLGVDLSLKVYDPASYYADLVAPPELAEVGLLIQVPIDALDGLPALREDVTAPRYGLPHDLDGNGAVDGNRRDADHLCLPVVVRVRWIRSKGARDEVVMSAWLRGER